MKFAITFMENKQRNFFFFLFQLAKNNHYRIKKQIDLFFLSFIFFYNQIRCSSQEMDKSLTHVTSRIPRSATFELENKKVYVFYRKDGDLVRSKEPISETSKKQLLELEDIYALHNPTFEVCENIYGK